MEKSTSSEYQGLNLLLLEGAGYEDERWLTLNNAKKAGYLVRKGSKAQTVETGLYQKGGQTGRKRPARP
ncbi:MAG: ArdC family protein [Deltaproteobacteria bacterium]|nr:ArdC family protein [Deltaproteobacteria bacterium]